MAQTYENELRSPFLCGLSPNEEERCENFREVFRDSATNSATSECARAAIIQAYRLAGSGAWDISSIHDVQMVLTAIEENVTLLPVIDTDVEHLLQRLERLGCSFRPTWNCVREKLTPYIAKVAAEGARAA